MMQSVPNKTIVQFIILAHTLLLASQVEVQGQDLLNGQPYESQVRGFIDKWCISCHGSEVQEADLRLDSLSPSFTDSQATATWIEVMDKVNLGEMPPVDEPQPKPDDAGFFTNWIATELRHASRHAHRTGGRVLMRRLSRTEYSNAVRDLLAVDFVAGEGPRELLPPDGTLDGFDKVSKALLLDPSLMEQYFQVAAVVADKAVQTGPPPVPTRRNRMEYEHISGGIEYIKESRTTIVKDDGIITMSQGMRSDHMLRHPWNDALIPVRGRYRLKVRLGADCEGPRRIVHPNLLAAAMATFTLAKYQARLDDPQVLEIERDFDVPGGNEIGINFENAPSFSRVNYHFSDLNRAASEASTNSQGRLAGRLRAQMLAQGFPNQGRVDPDSRTTDHMPRVFFDWIEMEGPLYDQWPPRSTELIFHRGTDVPEGEQLDYATDIFARLLPRAFRRPVQPTEVESVVGVVASELQHGEPFTEAIQSGIITMLCSPSFLLVNEPVDDRSQDTPRQLGDFETAFRLSLFLWSSIPDDQLYAAAKAGQLSDPDQLLAQVHRMLNNDRASALIDGFGRQWLKADEFDRFAIDRNLYRDFYSAENAGLNEAINAEPLEFFKELVVTNGSMTSFLDSDWTMANEVLARHYGISNVSGDTFVKVQLPAETHRGGLTTMAAVHKWGSDGNRTKPVERGKYLLDVLFNDPPKPPPPNAGEVEPNVQGEDLTVRQRLDKHRTIPSCANCHRTIDPYGLALENFNVIGRWRTKQDGEKGWWPDEAVIDASGTFPNGDSYESIEEFRYGLSLQSDRFLRGLCEKVFTYALGRVVEPSDRSTIDALVTRMKQNNHSFRSLVEGIVLSGKFQTK